MDSAKQGLNIQGGVCAKEAERPKHKEGEVTKAQVKLIGAGHVVTAKEKDQSKKVLMDTINMTKVCVIFLTGQCVILRLPVKVPFTTT